MKVLLLVLIGVIYLTFSLEDAFAQPKPFGLELGVHTKEETLEVIKKEGGKVTKSGCRIIKGDIANCEVEGVEVEDLPLEDLIKATFWFYKNRLFKIEYVFPLSMSKEEFYVIHKQLTQRYGNPKKFVKPYLANGRAEWHFQNIRLYLLAPWVSWSMYLTYEHLPLSRESEISDRKVFERETAKPRKGL
ncbi:MAG: hypothetical protein RMI74_08230 [Thermodesulfobacterium sp.]|nr:hypothetical protein [Thermodesulfobacterium sp.]